MAAPQPVSFRVDQELLDWARAYAAQREVAVSAVLEGGLLLLRHKAELAAARNGKGPVLPDRPQPVGRRRKRVAPPAWANGGGS